MPDAHFTAEVTPNAVDELAGRFMVSSSAMEWRLYNAGLAARPAPSSWSVDAT